jgi:hypothetical protein
MEVTAVFTFLKASFLEQIKTSRNIE